MRRALQPLLFARGMRRISAGTLERKQYTSRRRRRPRRLHHFSRVSGARGDERSQARDDDVIGAADTEERIGRVDRDLGLTSRWPVRARTPEEPPAVGGRARRCARWNDLIARTPARRKDTVSAAGGDECASTSACSPQFTSRRRSGQNGASVPRSQRGVA